MATMLKTALLVALVATLGCSDTGDDDAPDAAGLATTCNASDDRIRGCVRSCSTAISDGSSQTCNGATWSACVPECVAGVAAGAWCP